MHDDPSLAAALAARFVGAIAGAFLALVFIQPRTMREFTSRAGASVVAGVIFTHPLRAYLGWERDLESILAAACIAGFACWWVMGLVVRALNLKADLTKP